ncbi:MAG TPA: molybdopterin-dependent oxidoreductase, partial [Candidatus Acidoferrales bacterium]|nr:molybdopterin-dependent oxidoreductase [Candidatus Acidoferrales bacterium]
MMELTRRTFLQTAGAAAATLSLSNLEFAFAAWGEAGTPAAAPLSSVPIPTYRQWEDIYRQKWTWDKITKSTHIRTNCIAACSWNLYVKDGIVWREEQNTIYEPSHPSVPDMNPRGCQKGGCYSQLMYEPSRLKYPLRRVGDRGSGKWQRQSWDEALTQVADTLLDVAVKHGPDCIVYDH